jgi:two-component sensor histidine kinase
MVSITKNFDDLFLDAKQLQPLGIIMNELLTNTMKYAFEGRAHGMITVTASHAQGSVMVIVRGDGIGLPDGFSLELSKGFGLQLIQGLMQQLRGSMRIERDSGTRVVLEFKR